jgi:fibronectin type 3 domain-containing protein
VIERCRPSVSISTTSTTAVELVIDDDAIIDQIAVKVYPNKSGTSSYMNGAVVIRAKPAEQSWKAGLRLPE